MKTEENDTSRRKRRRLVLIIVAVVLLCAAVAAVTARYILRRFYDAGQIGATNFYFSVDLAGNSTMEGDNTGFSFPNVQSGQWNLYGGSQHVLDISVQNYFDDLRINAENINYEVSLYTIDPGDTTRNRVTTTTAADPKFVVTPQSSTTTASMTSYSGTLTTNSATPTKSADKLTVTIPSVSDWDYASGTKLVIRIKSTSPYVKTIDLTFVLMRLSNTFDYKVEDTANGQYAKLILRTNVDTTDANTTIQPYLSWPAELSIDNTNPLTFTVSNGNYTPQTNMESRSNMQISRALNVGESTYILFFKSDESKSYEVADWTTVNPDTSGNYYITLSEVTP